MSTAAAALISLFLDLGSGEGVTVVDDGARKKLLLFVPFSLANFAQLRGGTEFEGRPPQWQRPRTRKS